MAWHQIATIAGVPNSVAACAAEAASFVAHAHLSGVLPLTGVAGAAQRRPNALTDENWDVDAQGVAADLTKRTRTRHSVGAQSLPQCANHEGCVRVGLPRRDGGGNLTPTAMRGK